MIVSYTKTLHPPAAAPLPPTATLQNPFRPNQSNSFLRAGWISSAVSYTKCLMYVLLCSQFCWWSLPSTGSHEFRGEAAAASAGPQSLLPLLLLLQGKPATRDHLLPRQRQPCGGAGAPPAHATAAGAGLHVHGAGGEFIDQWSSQPRLNRMIKQPAAARLALSPYSQRVVGSIPKFSWVSWVPLGSCSSWFGDCKFSMYLFWFSPGSPSFFPPSVQKHGPVWMIVCDEQWMDGWVDEWKDVCIDGSTCKPKIFIFRVIITIYHP